MDWHSLPGLRIRGTMPVRYEGRVDGSELAEAMATRLEAKLARHLDVTPERIQFLGPPLFGTFGNWHVLLPIDSGEIRFEAEAGRPVMRYRIGYTRLLLTALVMASGAGVATRGFDHAPGFLFIFGFFFGVLFGLNFLISVPRVTSFLSRALDESIVEVQRHARHARAT